VFVYLHRFIQEYNNGNTARVFAREQLDLRLKSIVEHRTTQSVLTHRNGNGRAVYLPVAIPEDLGSRIAVCSAVEVGGAAQWHVHVVRSRRQLRRTCIPASPSSTLLVNSSKFKSKLKTMVRPVWRRTPLFYVIILATFIHLFKNSTISSI